MAQNIVNYKSKPLLSRSILVCGIAILMLLVGSSGCEKHYPSISDVKIFVEADGIYKIDADSLAKVGIELSDISLQNLRLSLRGIDQSLYVFQSGRHIWLEFFGRESDSLYSAQNIYQLEVLEHANAFTTLINDKENGASEPIQGRTVYQAAQRFEENTLYIPQIDGLDHWFWATATNGQTQVFPFQITELAQGAGFIRLDLWSNTEASAFPDHHLTVTINDQLILNETWDGHGAHQITGVVPDGVLKEGENLIVINTAGDDETYVEVDWINWFEVSYARRTIARDEQLKLMTEEQSYSISGFQGIVHLYDISDPDRVMLLATSVSGNSLVFDGSLGHSYYVVGEGGLGTPSSITPLDGDQDLISPNQEADYIVIGPDNLLPSTIELLRHRETQGLKVMQVSIQAIYDQFNYGFPEPEAIRYFLMDAMQTWEKSPRYVLLVGDASYDPRNYLQQPNTNILPSFFVQTQYGGQTASDIPFADLTGDGIPDIAIGRVPAIDNEEVSAFVEKTIRYEANISQQEPEFRLLAIADGQEPGFRFDAQRFLDIFPAETNRELFTPHAGITDANKTIVDYFNAGYSLIAYFGHGSTVMWGKDQLFTVGDAVSLSNASHPIMLNMTCLTGLFTHPQTESLTEVLLFNPSGGAVAIMAPTSLTLPGDQSFLSNSLGETFGGGLYERLGDGFLAAQQMVNVDYPGVREVLETFLLFGDPGLMLIPAP